MTKVASQIGKSMNHIRIVPENVLNYEGFWELTATILWFNDVSNVQDYFIFLYFRLPSYIMMPDNWPCENLTCSALRWYILSQKLPNQ